MQCWNCVDKFSCWIKIVQLLFVTASSGCCYFNFGTCEQKLSDSTLHMCWQIFMLGQNLARHFQLSHISHEAAAVALVQCFVSFHHSMLHCNSKSLGNCCEQLSTKYHNTAQYGTRSTKCYMMPQHTTNISKWLPKMKVIYHPLFLRHCFQEK